MTSLAAESPITFNPNKQMNYCNPHRIYSNASFYLEAMSERLIETESARRRSPGNGGIVPFFGPSACAAAFKAS